MTSSGRDAATFPIRTMTSPSRTPGVPRGRRAHGVPHAHPLGVPLLLFQLDPSQGRPRSLLRWRRDDRRPPRYRPGRTRAMIEAIRNQVSCDLNHHRALHRRICRAAWSAGDGRASAGLRSPRAGADQSRRVERSSSVQLDGVSPKDAGTKWEGYSELPTIDSTGNRSCRVDTSVDAGRSSSPPMEQGQRSTPISPRRATFRGSVLVKRHADLRGTPGPSSR